MIQKCGATKIKHEWRPHPRLKRVTDGGTGACLRLFKNMEIERGQGAAAPCSQVSPGIHPQSPTKFTIIRCTADIYCMAHVRERTFSNIVLTMRLISSTSPTPISIKRNSNKRTYTLVNYDTHTLFCAEGSAAHSPTRGHAPQASASP